LSTQCTQQSFSFGSAGCRKIVGRFDGGHISSFGGVGLLMLTEQITGIVRQLTDCFTDYRNPDRIEHTVEQLLRQRLFAMALGYEDLNDHDQLRHDPLLAAAIGKTNPIEQLPAGKSTLNRLELTPIGARSNARYKKIVPDRKAIERLFVDLFIQQQALTEGVPQQIILDLDATDITLHGEQPGRFYHGYYRDYCYLPLYIYCGEHLLCAKLRPSNIDGARGSVEQVRRIIEQIRTRWGGTQIILRADSGFCREPLMQWCEQNHVDYVFGLAKNKRLIKAIGKQLHEAKQLCESTGHASRVFAQLDYKTLKSWSRRRRVVAKAEHLRGGKSNPRFVVTTLSADDYDSRALYEDMYCPRGEAENRIKEQQLQLFADRLSTTAFRANQLRLWLSAIAYTLMRALVRLALHGSSWAKMQTRTLRERLLKIGAQVRVTVRKIWVSLSSGFPDQLLFAQAHERLCRWLI
tara:strand:- start:166 stop:1557 length:1392 start_codon:yes stop_codon:yes gene_type:complete